jgi:hypothetical protein
MSDLQLKADHVPTGAEVKVIFSPSGQKWVTVFASPAVHQTSDIPYMARYCFVFLLFLHTKR